MSEDGESPQPEDQPQEQKVPPTFTAYPAHAAATASNAAMQRILYKRTAASQRYIAVVINIILCKCRNIILGLKLGLFLP
jgi:hypothetical protein